jgi:hypothetical protein
VARSRVFRNAAAERRRSPSSSIKSDSTRPRHTLFIRPEYVSQKLDPPLPTKDGRTLRTIRDACDYMTSMGERALVAIGCETVKLEGHLVTPAEKNPNYCY